MRLTLPVAIVASGGLLSAALVYHAGADRYVMSGDAGVVLSRLDRRTGAVAACVLADVPTGATRPSAPLPTRPDPLDELLDELAKRYGIDLYAPTPDSALGYRCTTLSAGR